MSVLGCLLIFAATDSWSGTSSHISLSSPGSISIAESVNGTQTHSNQKLGYIGCYGVNMPYFQDNSFNYVNLFTVAPLLVIGLFGFAWTSLGPPHVHWIAPMIFAALIAIANVRDFTTHKQVPMLTPHSILSIWLQLTTWSPVMGHILHRQQEATHLLEISFLVLLPCIRHLVSRPFTQNP